jgi:photosystem II stability/assembly factor-like uncharacterized protein
MIKQLIKSILIIVIIITTSYQIKAQWYEVTNLPSDWSTWVIDSYDSSIACGPYGDDVLYITTNGGANWNTIFKPCYIDDISMIGSDKIWISNSIGEIWATKDGGDNWVLQFYDPQKTDFMNYIEMFDSLNGVAMGDAPSDIEPALFLRTTDGGEHWSSMNDTCLIGLWSADTWRCIDFININIGYFYSYRETPRKLYKTTDGGFSWVKLKENMGCEILKFYDEDLGIVKGENCPDSICYPQIYRTLNGGLTWEMVETDSIGYGLDIEFIPDNPSNVWLLAGNRGYASIDSGKTWIEQFYNHDFHPGSGFLDIVFTDKNHGWLLGRESLPTLEEHLFHTANGGFGGISNVKKEDESPANFYLYQNFPNPFNSLTSIKYFIPVLSYVILSVFDVLGNKIVTLENEEKPAGVYEVEFNGTNLSSGIYFYRLNSGNFSQTKKFILLK